MARVEMEAALTITVGGGLIKPGETFEVANEEDARLYEHKGLATRAKKKDKAKEPERTQDVQAEEPSGSRQTKKRSTKSEE